MVNVLSFDLHWAKLLLMKEAADPGMREGHVVFVAGFNDVRGPQWSPRFYNVLDVGAARSVNIVAERDKRVTA